MQDSDFFMPIRAMWRYTLVNGSFNFGENMMSVELEMGEEDSYDDIELEVMKYDMDKIFDDLYNLIPKAALS